jgi:hypothetical protein
VLIHENSIVLATALSHAEALMTNASTPSTDVVDLSSNSSAVHRLDFAGICTLLRRNSKSVMAALSRSGSLPVAEAQLVHSHVDAVLQALSAIKSMTTRSWRDGNDNLEHCWLFVDDNQ